MPFIPVQKHTFIIPATRYLGLVLFKRNTVKSGFYLTVYTVDIRTIPVETLVWQEISSLLPLEPFGCPTVWCNQMGTVRKLFSRGYNFWTNDRISTLKTPTHPYSCSAKPKVIFLFRTCLNVWFISCMLMKSYCSITVPIWLHHTVVLVVFRSPNYVDWI